MNKSRLNEKTLGLSERIELTPPRDWTPEDDDNVNIL